MDFAIMFFSSAAGGPSESRYRLLVDAARWADTRGFSAVSTPERHFHRFGGLFPNPAVVGSALAMCTDRLQIRAGSLISPLHDAIRIAEEWSVVDNLSGGRAAVSFGSGWAIDDFVLAPAHYEERQAVMYRQIEEVRALWRGEPVIRRNSRGRDVAVTIFPRPLQAELPVWVTSSGNPATFATAGRLGANVLTHLIGQDLAALEAKIGEYRRARAEAGHAPEEGKVTLMLHTFLGEDLEQVERQVRGPFREYLRSAISLEQLSAMAGGVISGGHRIAAHNIPDTAMEELLDIAFARYWRSSALMGTPDTCQPLLWTFAGLGVDEVACLIDFMDDVDAVMESLQLLDTLRLSLTPAGLTAAGTAAVQSFLGEVD